MRKGTYVLLIILFFVVLAGAGIFAYFALEFGRPVADVPARAYLDVTLAGNVDEIPPTDFFTTVVLGRRPLAIRDIWSNFRKARVDARIRAVLVRLDLLGCDWAKASEIRDAILEFRRSGKKVYAFIEEAPQFDKEYYIATACDRIILHPLGWLGIPGLGGYVPFFKGTLDKIGVKAEFEHVEEYKTAYNIFTEKGFTPAHKEEMESLYGDIFDVYVRTAAKARGTSEEEYRALMKRAFFQGEQAKEAGLVDDCLYEDQLRDLLREEGARLGAVPFSEYTKVDPTALGLETGRKVALIYGVGAIVTGESLPQVMGGRTVARWIREAREDPSIMAVIFRVDSPGGSSVGSDDIWREIVLAKKVKPVVVSMSDVAGSGGYWVAMGATKIVAQPQTLTGSIGVLAGKFTFAGLLEKLGVTAEKLTFGSEADFFSSFRSFTPEERKLLKDQILWVYDRFIAKVAEGRRLTRDEVNAIGRGRVWTGRQARDLKLVDELGGMTAAVALAKREAGIPAAEDVGFVVWPKARSFWEALFGLPSAGIDLKSEVGLGKALDAVRLMQRTSIWAFMPFWVLQ